MSLHSTDRAARDLADGGDVAGPELQLVLLEQDGGLGGVEVVAPDQLQLHVLHRLGGKTVKLNFRKKLRERVGTMHCQWKPAHLAQDDVEELHVVVVGGLHLAHQPDLDLHLGAVGLARAPQHHRLVVVGEARGGEDLGAKDNKAAIKTIDGFTMVPSKINLGSFFLWA